jgi:hypothetical protein
MAPPITITPLGHRILVHDTTAEPAGDAPAGVAVVRRIDRADWL